MTDPCPSSEPDAAERDPLTGLPPIAVARRWLEREDGTGPGGAGSIHALLLGLRRFDAVNLAYGAGAGDLALIEVAARITQFATAELEGPWLVTRGPGGTFLLLATEACSRERWQLFAEQLADRVARPLALGGATLRLSPRIALLRGLAGEGAGSALDRLAQSLASAMRAHGRRVVWVDGIATRIGRTAAQLESDLLHALDAGAIEVVFQPQFACADDRLTGAEALARWNHPLLGRVGAATLFAVAERADLLAPLSRHIAGLALAAARDWPRGLRLSLNVTPADLAVAGYAGQLSDAVRASGFDPALVTVELTEQALLADVALARAALGGLADKGFRVALDDFGAGFCNFRYLKLLPLHYLKLDRTMIDGIEDDPRDLAVLRGIIAMAHALDLQVIAEGIETEAQRVTVSAEGCATYQGFLRAKPMTAQDFAGLARREKS